MGWYDRKVRRVRDLSCGDMRIFLELEVRRIDCRRCGKVKRERLNFLADNPLYTKRFGHVASGGGASAKRFVDPSGALSLSRET
jgi:transposase